MLCWQNLTYARSIDFSLFLAVAIPLGCMHACMHTVTLFKQFYCLTCYTSLPRGTCFFFLLQDRYSKNGGQACNLRNWKLFQGRWRHSPLNQNDWPTLNYIVALSRRILWKYNPGQDSQHFKTTNSLSFPWFFSPQSKNRISRRYSSHMKHTEHGMNR